MRASSFASVVFCLGASLATGCGAGPLDLDATVKSASLSDAESLAVVILGGATWGEALLTFTDEDDVVRDVPIAFAGPSVGLLMDVHVMQSDFLFDGSTKTELQLPDDPVTANDLFGLYDGGGGGLALGLGVCGLAIDNRASVRLVIEGPCGGVSIAHEENWLTLGVDGDVVERAPE
jgi:hypothetical protein